MDTICVFCGSNAGARPAFIQAAEALGRALARRGLGLVYGGAKVGAMGALARAVLETGGRVVGVIPAMLVEKEVAFLELPDLRVVGSMHERKALMAELADGFIALPGGLGTIEEFFEMITWAQLGMHSKPCGMLNVCGYYDKLLEFLDHAANQRFIRQEHRAMIMVDQDPESLLERFAHYRAPQVDKWIDRRGGLSPNQ